MIARDMGSGGLFGSRMPRHDHSGQRSANYNRIWFPENFQLAKLADVDNLKRCWRDLQRNGGQAAGVDRRTFADFCPVEMFSIIRVISESLINMTYKPRPVRKLYFKKEETGRFRELSIQTLGDRVVSKALYEYTKPFWNDRLPHFGEGVLELFARLENDIRQQEAYYLAIDDIADCFPSAQRQQLIQCQHRHFHSREAQWLTETIICGHPDDHSDELIGIGQGSPYSPIAVECVLYHHFGIRLDRRFRRYLYLYVDNVNILTRSMPECIEALDQSQQLLSQIGFNLKGHLDPQKRHMIDLRSNANVKVLGLIPTWNPATRTLSFNIDDQTYETLKEKLLDALAEDQPRNQIELIIHGWLRSMAPVHTSRRRVEIISKVSDVLRNLGIHHLNRSNLLNVCRTAKSIWDGRQRTR